MSLRIEKINSLVQQSISEIINRDLSLKPGLFVSIVKVDTTKDLRYTRIFVSVFPIKEQEYVMATLKKEIYRIQGILNQKLQTKIVPKIEFILDEKQEQVSAIDKLIEKIHKEDENGF